MTEHSLVTEHNKDILVIDDNSINLRLLHDMLESQGYSIATADSGVEGIKQAALLNPKLILLDVQMPAMSGKEVLLRLKANSQLEHLPVIAVTALAMSGDEQELLDFGFDAYISKPVRLKTLIEAVQGFIG